MHSYFLRFQNCETSDKKTQKEKKREQHYRDAKQGKNSSTSLTNVDTSTIAAIYDSFDSYHDYNSHHKFNAPGQAGKSLIILENLLLVDASTVFHLQQYKHMVCRERTCLDELHGCGQPFDLKKLIAVALKFYD